jgi:hypothetical protein
VLILDSKVLEVIFNQIIIIETSGIRFIDESKEAPYMNIFITELEKFGFVSGKSFRHASYDWRFSPLEYLENKKYTDLIRLIENTFEINNQTKVHLLSHSYGAPFLNYILSDVVTQEWKDKYVASFIPMGGAHDGSFNTLGVYSSLELSSEAPSWVNSAYRRLSASLSSAAWMVPSVGRSKHVIIKTPRNNYTIDDLPKFFRDLNQTNIYELYRSLSIHKKAKVPNVPVHCIYGFNVSTPIGYEFDKLPGNFKKIIVNIKY